MNQADAVASHYQSQIRATTRFNAERGNPVLVGWLENSVAPLIEKWLEDSRFREMATYSLRRLARPNDTQEYSAFLAVHSGITSLASSIYALLDQPTVQSVLIEKPGYRRWAQVSFGNSPDIWITSTLNRLTSLSQLTATSLVSENDYFSPTAGLYTDEHPPIRLSSLTTISSPRLNLPGDMVFWCLQVRLEYFFDELHRLRNSLSHLSQDPSNSTRIQDVADRASELYRVKRVFSETVQFGGERQKCESAVTMLQAYCSARNQDMREWLGLNYSVRHSHHSFYHEIQRVGGIAVTDQVLAALEKTREVLELPKSRDELMDEYVATYRIVMADGGSTVHFDSEVIIDHGISCRTDKHVGTAQLELLQKLIESAQYGNAVSHLDLSAYRAQGIGADPGFTLGNATPKAIRDRRSKLKNSIPPELNDLIESDSGEYRLALNRDEVYVFHPRDKGDFRG